MGCGEPLEVPGDVVRLVLAAACKRSLGNLVRRFGMSRPGATGI